MIVATLVVACLVGVNAGYVGAEFAAVAARRTRLAALADEGHRVAARVLPQLEDAEGLDELVAASQVGITLSSLALGAYGQAAIAAPLVAPWLADALGMGSTAALATASATVLLALTAAQVLFGELIPKAYALRYPERTMIALGPATLFSIRLLRPFIALFNGSANVLLRLGGYEGSARHAHLHAPEEIELLVTESGEAGALDPAERRMLHNALDLGEMMARQVMIPRNRLVLGRIDDAPAELLNRLAETPYATLPVYRDTPDRVVGAVDLKELFRADIDGLPPHDVVRDVDVVPETAPVTGLWERMVFEGEPLTIVIDEYGGTAGAVTREDLIEEVLGEVLDEFDARPDAIIRRASGVALIRGDVSVDEVNDSLGLALPVDRGDTLAGLVIDALGRIPAPGDEVTVAGGGPRGAGGGVLLRVLAVRGRSIVQVGVGPIGVAGAPATAGAEGGPGG